MSIRKFEDFECWQLARKLDQELFPLTTKNGFEKDFKLKDQILSSSGSIMDNIAEGFGRRSNRDFIRFLSYSHGSADELQSQLYRAKDRGYITEEEFQSLYDQSKIIAKKVGALMNALDKSTYKPDFHKKVNPGDSFEYKRKFSNAHSSEYDQRSSDN